ncbi:MAG: choice-of-anchor A family protein [Gemmatimonadaceae bacterium]
MKSGIAIAALVLAASAPLRAQTISPFDVFVFQDFTLMNTEVNGRIAIGGDATFTNWRVGHMLAPGYTDYGLVVGQDLTSRDGSVAQGRTYVGGVLDAVNTGFPAAYPPEVGGPSVVDFAAESARLTSLSDGYAAMGANGSTQLVNGELNFIGNSNYNIFSISMALLQQGTAGYEFVTPFGSTSIINVLGSSTNSAFNNTAFYFNCTAVATSSSCQSGTNENTPAGAARTLWNFNDQTDIVFGGPVHGSILAPNADAEFGVGDVVGTVVVKSGTANSEFYSNHDYSGELPITATPEPATFGLLALGLGVIALGAMRRRRLQPSKAV